MGKKQKYSKHHLQEPYYVNMQNWNIFGGLLNFNFFLGGGGEGVCLVFFFWGGVNIRCCRYGT